MIWARLMPLRRRLALWLCPDLGEQTPALAVAPEDLCHLCNLLAKSSGRAVSTIARLTSGSGDTVRRLEQGKRITTDRATRILVALEQLWPDDLPWPADIPRPARVRSEDAA